MSDRPASEVELADNPVDLHRVNRQSFIDEQEWILYKCVETDLKEVRNMTLRFKQTWASTNYYLLL
jgi:hypothetical protein